MPLRFEQRILSFLTDSENNYQKYLESPAPSLQFRGARGAPHFEEDEEHPLRIASINAQGALFFAYSPSLTGKEREDEEYEKDDEDLPPSSFKETHHPLQSYLLKTPPDRPLSRLDCVRIKLPDDWTVSLPERDGYYKLNGGIPLKKLARPNYLTTGKDSEIIINTDDVTIGRFDTDSGAIDVIGTIPAYKDERHDDHQIVAMNRQSAVIFDKRKCGSWDKMFYFVQGTRLAYIPHGSYHQPFQDTHTNITIDPQLDRVMWRHFEQSKILYFDKRPGWSITINFDGGCQRDTVAITKTWYTFGMTLSSVEVPRHFDPEKTIQKPRELPFAGNERIITPLGINPSKTMVFGQAPVGNERQKDLYAPVIKLLATGIVAEETEFSDTELGNIIISTDGRLMARQQKNGRFFIWEACGINLDSACSFEDRICLNEFRKLYEKSCSNKTKIYLASWELYNKYKQLESNPLCQMPCEWKTEFKPPRKAIKNGSATDNNSGCLIL